jgi:hypothetical protein
MPDLVSSIEQLADLPLYKIEKPYAVLVTATEDKEEYETNNITMTRYNDINFIDVRDRSDEFNLDTAGFEVGRHVCKRLSLPNATALREYEQETAIDYLKEKFGAVHVECYESRVSLI